MRAHVLLFVTYRTEYTLTLCNHMAMFTIVFAGDVNIPCSDWCNLVSFFTGDPLVDIMITCDLTQTVTREAGMALSRIDVIFISNDISTCGRWCLRPQDLIFPPGNTESPKKLWKKLFDAFTKSDDHAMLDCLWEFCDNMPGCITTLWDALKDAIHYCNEKFVLPNMFALTKATCR